VITPRDLSEELTRLCRKLDEAHTDLVQRSTAWAKAESEYRVSKAQAFQIVRSYETKPTVPEREAMVDQLIDRQKYERDLTESAKVNALELVRSLRAQLSAVQSISAAVRSEMELAR
jgi:hypothetical protein